MATMRQTQIADQQTRMKMQFEAAMLILLIRWANVVKNEIAKGFSLLNIHQSSLATLLEKQYVRIANRFKKIIIQQLNAGQLPTESLNDLIERFNMNEALIASNFIVNTLQKILESLKDPPNQTNKELAALWIVAAINHFKAFVVLNETQVIAEHTKEASAFYFNSLTGTIRQKTWVTFGDNRVRLWHMEASGQQQQVGQFFIVGPDKLLFPRDPTGSLDNIMNCRCSSILVGI